MFLIAYETFFWKSFIYLRKMKFTEILVMVVVIAIGLIIDLAVAVIVGVMI